MAPTIYPAAIGAITGLIAYQAYTSSQLWNALTLIFIGGLLFYGIRTKLIAWKTLTRLQNPQIMALIFIGLGFTYISFNGFDFWPSTFFSTGTALIGFALGTVVYGLWNLR